jgi:release factor glutamine methyltransferase
VKGDNLQAILTTASRRLVAAGCDAPTLEAEVLLAHALGQDRVWLYTHPQHNPPANLLDKFYHLLNRRERREPVAYLTGHKEFFALDFIVNPYVLIPRPETELLVETAIEAIKRVDALTNQATPYTIVDVGTGSGCISVTLAKHLSTAKFLAIDYSAAALNVARQNAVWHGVAASISFLQSDLLQSLSGPVDMIVSNPPYVSQNELAAASPEVSYYEPRLALEGGNDGLKLVHRLLAQAQSQLKPNGSLLVEIGSNQGGEVTRLAKKYFPNAAIQLKKDLAGLDRLLIVAQSDQFIQDSLPQRLFDF